MANPDSVLFSAVINSVDVTGYVDLRLNPVEITSALDEELDTATLTLTIADAVAPVEWQEIVLYDDTDKIFGGYVVTVEKSAHSSGVGNNYLLGCADYGALFDKVIVKNEYEAMTDAEILDEIFTDATELAGYDSTTHVKTLFEFPRVRFNRKTVREILDWFCTQTGGHWYVDYDKKLHYFGSEEENAPFDVTDSPADSTRKTVQNIVISKNGGGVVNLVEVVGGSKRSEDTTEYYTSSSNRAEIFLSKKYIPASTLQKVQVRRNDGGPTTNLIVNPSFEVDITSGITQFEDGSAGQWYREANAGAFGSYVLRIRAGTALVGVRYGNVSLAPGESITASVTCWCADIGKAGVRIYNVDASSVLATAYNQKKQTWERAACTYTNATAGSINVRLELINIANDSARYTYYDGVQLEKLAYPSAYCDGTRGTGHAWTGTAHNSTSTRVDMAVWTTLTLKTGGVDTLSSLNEILYYQSTSRLEQQVNLPTMKNGIEIFGRYEIPMRTRVRNQASHDHYGKWMEAVVNAPEIVDKAVGQMRGKAELAKNAFSNTALGYDILEPGLRAGQMQHCRFTAKGIDGFYLVQRVSTLVGVGGYVNSKVDLGVVDPSLVGFLLNLKRENKKEIEWNENEVLDELLDTPETVTLKETIGAVGAYTGPYYFSDDPEEAFLWGAGAFDVDP